MLPVRTCSATPPPTYEIALRLMPDCDTLPDPPGPLVIPPQLDIPMPEPAVINFGCFLPAMTTELVASEATTSMQHIVTAKDGDPCQFSLHTILELPRFVVDPIRNPPCGAFGAEVSTSFGRYATAPDGVTPPARLPYATTSMSNYAVSATALDVANTKTKFGAKVNPGQYAITGTVDPKCDRYVFECTAPPIELMVTWYPDNSSIGAISSLCPSLKALCMSLAGSGPGVPYFNWVRFNSLGMASFKVYAVNGAGNRTMIGQTTLTPADTVGNAEYGSWCAVSLLPGLYVKVDAVLEDPDSNCYDLALMPGDTFDVAVCKDDTEPCNRHLSIDIVFPRMFADARIQKYDYLLNGVYAGNKNHFKQTKAVVVTSPSVDPGDTYLAQLYEDDGSTLGNPVTCYNGTGRTLSHGESVVVELPEPNIGCTSSTPFGCRPAGYEGGYLTIPGAASNTTVSMDVTDPPYADGTALYRTSMGWSLLDNKLSVPAICGIAFNGSVVIMGEIAMPGVPGTIYYAAVNPGSVAAAPPAPVTEEDPADEQWIRILAVQVNADRRLVNPMIVPLRAVPVAMCQGDIQGAMRLVRFGTF